MLGNISLVTPARDTYLGMNIFLGRCHLEKGWQAPTTSQISGLPSQNGPVSLNKSPSGIFLHKNRLIQVSTKRKVWPRGANAGPVLSWELDCTVTSPSTVIVLRRENAPRDSEVKYASYNARCYFISMESGTYRICPWKEIFLKINLSTLSWKLFFVSSALYCFGYLFGYLKYNVITNLPYFTFIGR